MAENKLTHTKVKAAKTPGYLGDGGGLHLQVTKNQAGEIRKSWVYRYKLHGKSREMGLGPLASDLGLSEARAKRNEWREVLKSGKDPIEERERRKQSAALEAAHTVTFRQAVSAFMLTNAHRWRSEATKSAWQSEFDRYCTPILGNLSVRDITGGDIDRVLEQPRRDHRRDGDSPGPKLWACPALGSRVRCVLEEIFDWTRARGYRDAENPAQAKRVRQSLGRPRKHTPRNFTAMPKDDVPNLVARLQERQIADPTDSVSFALEFLILVATRSGTVRQMRWEQVNLETGVWHIPGEANKSGRPFRVALSPRAMEILRSRPGVDGPRAAFVFAGINGMMGRNTMRIWLQTMLKTETTLHGFRSSFKVWATKAKSANGQWTFPRTLSEIALDHVVGDATELAYLRKPDGDEAEDFLEERFPLMRAWADFVGKPSEPATVLPIAPIMAAAAG
jgi:integrase